MKQNSRVTSKRISIFVLSVTILFMMAYQAAWADTSRSIYYKLFTDLSLDVNGKVTVTCDSYDDHVTLFDGDEIEKNLTQYDPILGVSALCKDELDGHMDPVVHIDGFEGDVEDYYDVEDGRIDRYKAVVVCNEGPDENGEVMFNPPTAPLQIILECMDHDAIVASKEKKQ